MTSAVRALLAGLAIAALAQPSAGAASSLKERLSHLRPIPLKRGANLIANFAGDGRTALITSAWRDNGNAWGFNVYQVMLPARPGAQDWNVVDVQMADHPHEIVTDQPHTGEDIVRSVRFMRGDLDGKPAALLITATRELGATGGVPDPSAVTIEVATLHSNPDGEVGITRDYFATAASYKTTTLYCNSDMALSREIGLALPASYDGPRNATGCG